jgi:hypothetical protein
VIEAEKERLELRTASYFFILEGVAGLGIGIAYFMGPRQSATSIEWAGYQLLNAFSGLFLIAIGIGIQRRKAVWRTIGAWVAGLSCGDLAAIVLFAYWPLGPSEWDQNFFVQLFALGFTGWQLWAVTNLRTRIYFSKIVPGSDAGRII